MKTAVIVGGSIAGLTAAKALSKHFEEIIIIEPDKIFDEDFQRKGVPQGNHVHGLLKGGEDALTSLFPSLPEVLEQNGAVSADFCSDVRWYLNRRWMPRFKGNLPIFFQTRSLLERCLRSDVELQANIKFVTQCRAKCFSLSEDNKRVEFVVLTNSDNTESKLKADFFVDAMGRGSFMPNWLAEMGIGSVRETQVKVGLGYASCFFSLPEDEVRDWSSLLIYPQGPDEYRGATLVKVENNRWLLTLAGYHSDHPPADKVGFLKFAESLPQPDVFNAIQNATPLSEIKLHKFPHGFRRFYGELKHFPLSLIPVGDSNGSLNPLFGQGMSATALSATTLGRLFDHGRISDDRGLDELKTAYFKALNEIYKTPWDLALGQDFRFAKTEGDVPFALHLRNIFKDMILRSSSDDIVEKFFQVVHLVEKESCFYNPRRILKILATQR